MKNFGNENIEEAKMKVLPLSQAYYYLDDGMICNRGYSRESLRIKAQNREMAAVKVDGLWYFNSDHLDWVIEERNRKFQDFHFHTALICMSEEEYRNDPYAEDQ